MAGNDNSTSRFLVPEATASRPHKTWLTIRKSRFLTQTCHCPTIESAREFIALIKSANPDATHNCWAYLAGPPGDSARVGSSDDGEPHGTAGRPMLNVLLHCGAGQLCAVVSRWFGGIKLGTGGLVRAYQDSVRENLGSLPLVWNIRRENLRIRAEYSYLDRLRQLLARHEARIENETYGSRVEIDAAVPEDAAAELKTALARDGAEIVEKFAPDL